MPTDIGPIVATAFCSELSLPEGKSTKPLIVVPMLEDE